MSDPSSFDPIICTELSPFGEWLFVQPRPDGRTVGSALQALGGMAAARARWQAEQQK